MSTSFLDLGVQPPCESYVAEDRLQAPEAFFPLHAYLCDECLLVQLPEVIAPEQIFAEYAYFSSYSSSWVHHARLYVDMACSRFRLGLDSRVVELASNDGYLLQHFVARGIPVLGVEPAANVARVAIERGVRTLIRFFGRDAAEEIRAEFGCANLIVGNNVLAHVPDINGFVSGVARLLAPAGVVTMEFPHLLSLIAQTQFDTIYHEHYSYLSLRVVERLFEHHGLTLFDVEELATHGGSLRVFACHAGCTSHPMGAGLNAVRAKEAAAGFDRRETYLAFTPRVQAVKRRLLEFLIGAKERGKRVAGYGAPGKGNTLLNYCGIRTDLLDFTVDANPYKQGKYTPGARIPIRAPQAIRSARPDYVLILPWNLADEIRHVASYIREWDGRFVVPIPTVEVL